MRAALTLDESAAIGIFRDRRYSYRAGRGLAEGNAPDRLLKLAQQYEYGARAVVVREKSVESLPSPAILVLRRNHCVVYLGTDPETGRARIVEPSRRLTGSESLELVRRHWSGEAIVFASRRMPLLTLLTLNGLGALTILLVVVGIRRFRGSGSGPKAAETVLGTA